VANYYIDPITCWCETVLITLITYQRQGAKNLNWGLQTLHPPNVPSITWQTFCQPPALINLHLSIEYGMCIRKVLEIWLDICKISLFYNYKDLYRIRNFSIYFFLSVPRKTLPLDILNLGWQIVHTLYHGILWPSCNLPDPLCTAYETKFSIFHSSD